MSSLPLSSSWPGENSDWRVLSGSHPSSFRPVGVIWDERQAGKHSDLLIFESFTAVFIVATGIGLCVFLFLAKMKETGRSGFCFSVVPKVPYYAK